MCVPDQVAAKLIHGTLKDSSVALSNLIGPVEQMALQNHPVKGFYFTVAGVPVVTCLYSSQMSNKDNNSYKELFILKDIKLLEESIKKC